VLQAARRHVWVETDAGVTRLRVRGGVDLVPGDQVIPDPGGAVSRRLERKNVLARRTAREARVLVANVDDLAIVTAAGAQRSGAGMIARCIAAALAEGITPVVVLNKADADATSVLPARAAGWRRLGFEAFVISAREGTGLDALEARFRGREVALVGASGVGKSTLINALHPEADQRTGDVGALGHGRHVTTLGRAIRWPGGLLVDLPGVRTFGLVDPTGLAAAFPDVAAQAALCRFSDCAHGGEPGCAVAEAVARGELDPERLEVYRSIRESLDAGTEGTRPEPPGRRRRPR